MYQIIDTPKGGIAVFMAEGKFDCSVVNVFEKNKGGTIAITEHYVFRHQVPKEEVREFVLRVKRRLYADHTEN